MFLVDLEKYTFKAKAQALPPSGNEICRSWRSGDEIQRRQFVRLAGLISSSDKYLGNGGVCWQDDRSLYVQGFVVPAIESKSSAEDHIDCQKLQRRERQVLYAASDALDAEPGDLYQCDCPSESVGLVFVPNGLAVHIRALYIFVFNEI